MKEIERIASMLGSDAVEKRIAAAVVLTELGSKAPVVLQGLVGLLESNLPVLQRHGLEALGKLGGVKQLPKILPLLLSGDAEVRSAAVGAVAALGDDAVPAIKERMAVASPEEKRTLEATLARMGSGTAFHTLLATLEGQDQEAARQAALAVRQFIKDADAKGRRAYLSETEKFLARKKAPPSPNAVAAAIKILGFLEDEKALTTIVTYLKDEKAPWQVRQEAVIAVRFALKESGKHANVIDALLGLAEGTDRSLARTATDTLLGLQLPPALASRLARLAGTADSDRAKVAMEQLSQQNTKEATKALVDLIVTQPRQRAEAAMGMVANHPDAGPMLARALLKTTDADRAWLLRKAVKACGGGRLDRKLRDEVLEAAFEKISDGATGWEALLEVARDADPETTADALRELAGKLKKAKKEDRAISAFRTLCRSPQATDDDRYLLASMELSRSKLDTHPLSRERDEGIKLVDQLLNRRFDVGKALRKDRAITLEHKFYLGFHFAEKGHPLGEDLLEEVVQESPRTKMGKIARNKLKLAESA